VRGNHTYAEDGSQTVTVSVSDAGGNNFATTSTATIADAALSAATGVNVSATEGADTTSVAVATFKDASPGDHSADFTATIAWGDGHTSAGTVSYDSGTQTYTVRGNHIYAEDGTQTVTVSVSDEGGNSFTTTSTASIADAALSAAAGVNVSATEGADTTSVAVATFKDANPGDHSADFTTSIAWGDGHTSAGTVSYDSGTQTYTVRGNHIYAEDGTQTVTVSVSDEGGNSFTTTSTASIADAALSAAAGVNVSATEGADTTSVAVATFKDANPGDHSADFTTSIDWGDGHTSAGTVSYDSGTQTYTVRGNHTYAEDGTQTVTVSVSDEGGNSSTTTSTASIAEVPPTMAVPTIADSSNAGAFREGDMLTASTTVTTDDGIGINGNSAISYQWQRSANGVSGWSDVGSNSASYTLSENDKNSYLQVITSFTDDTGQTVTQTSAATAEVVDVPPTMAVPTIADSSNAGAFREGDMLTASTTVTTDDGIGINGNSAISYQWQRSANGVSGWSNVGSNSASYMLTENDENSYLQVITSFTDDTGQTVTQTSAATAAVIDAPPTLTVPGALSTNENTPLTITGIAMTEADADDALSMSLSVAHGTLALGSTNGLTVTSNGSNGTLAFSGSQSAISAALVSGVIYTPTSEYEASDILTVTGTNTENGTGVSKNITVNITGKAEPPTLTVQNA